MAVKVVSYREMNNYDVKHKINTTSRSTDWGKGLSPFILGPVNTYGGMVANNVENAWQFSKVYSEHLHPDGTINFAEYIRWRNNGWRNRYAHRYPMGKGQKPAFALWKKPNGDYEQLDYIESRKKIYAPIYAQGVLKSTAWKKLKDLYESGDDFVLIDFDGYDYVAEGKTLIEVINDPTRKMGHAFVLAMLLEYPELRKRYGG